MTTFPGRSRMPFRLEETQRGVNGFSVDLSGDGDSHRNKTAHSVI